MAKITNISLLQIEQQPIPKYKIWITTNDYDKKRHRIILRVNNSFYDLNPNSLEIDINIFATNPNNVNVNKVLRIYAQLFDYLDDKIIYTKVIEYKYYIPLQKYIKVEPEILTTSDAFIANYWTKGKLVASISGPYDTNGQIVSKIKMGKNYLYRAIPNQELKPTELLSIQWAYKYDNEKIRKFKHQDEIFLQNSNVAYCSFPKQPIPKNITVYAYFIKESEKVAIKTEVLSEEIKKTDNSIEVENNVENGDYVKITIEQIEELFGKNKKYRDFKQEIIDNFNKYNELAIINNKPLHIDTPLRKAHFFAQVGAETLGINPDWMVETDVFKYSVKSAKVFGSRAEKLESLNLLQTYCDEKPQKKLLNYVYAQENGKGNGNGNEASGDGYKFRSRGLKQITGKDNYKIASQYIKEIFPDQYID